MSKKNNTFPDKADSTQAVSSFLLSAIDEFKFTKRTLLSRFKTHSMPCEIHKGRNSLWLLLKPGEKNALVCRLCYSPSDIKSFKRTGNKFTVVSELGRFNVNIKYYEDENIVRAETVFTPSKDVTLPFMPRDIYCVAGNAPLKTKGKVYARQRGPKGGFCYFSISAPRSGSFLYFQNFTSLNKYFEISHTSPEKTVGGEWPELGFALPVSPDKVLKKGKQITLSDYFIAYSGDIPQRETEAGRQFLDLFSKIYLHLPKPQTEYFDWIDNAEKTINSLSTKNVLRRIRKGFFLNAYTASIEKPPESMVQLAILVPLIEYKEWKSGQAELISKLQKNISKFFDEKIGSIVRWLPGESFPENNSEEEKADKMDSWYLHHSLMNYGRLAEYGNKEARKLFLKSVNYVMKVAHKFKYEWPIFFDLKSLKVIKDTPPGELGEVDVGGLYAKVMLQAYKVTKDRQYVDEAEKAVAKMKGLGFGLMYQTNSTILSAGAIADLFKITHEKKYLDLSILCMANVIYNAWLWECDYGHAKNYSTFFGLPPLHDGKYMAPYEEAESLAVCNYYLKNFKDELPESVITLLSEYMKYLLHRGKFFYPEYLPESIIAEKSREGKIDKELTLPLEDIYDGWQKAGQVGQEVYGAATSFIAVTCSYINKEDLPFIIYCNYPALNTAFKEVSNNEGKVEFRVYGNNKLNCEIRIIPKNLSLNKFEFNCTANERKLNFKSIESHLIAKTKGNEEIILNWKTKKK